MSGARWMRSPLVGTFAVVGGLGLLAFPLLKLTGSQAGQAPVSVKQVPDATETDRAAILRIKLIDAVDSLFVRTVGGKVVVESGALSAGETEYDVTIPFSEGVCELVFSAKTGERETAMFLTVMPDGFPDQTRYLTGSGEVEEVLRFEWHSH